MQNLSVSVGSNNEFNRVGKDAFVLCEYKLLGVSPSPRISGQGICSTCKVHPGRNTFCTRYVAVTAAPYEFHTTNLRVEQGMADITFRTDGLEVTATLNGDEELEVRETCLVILSPNRKLQENHRRAFKERKSPNGPLYLHDDPTSIKIRNSYENLKSF